MNKIKLSITCLTIFSMSITAQIQKGTNLGDIGLGLSSYGTPIHLGFEHLVTNEIGVGLAVNYTSYKDNDYLNDYKWSFIYGGIKGNYHFNKVLNIDSKFDVYGGLTLGYWKATLKDENTISHTSLGNSAFFSGQVGGRYFLTDKFNVFLEAGGGNISGLTAGVSLKF
ncbi:hypothetical protein SLW70_10470 [Flavobacterium sp. NG2]|uniref:outer membrane beta-barrel protein n=1 Tax=Flavobacterium sp. NG2 TaxID=3097547 RepID=UPI002A7F6951|nr:outer membrane beta-barrel protein [Flavobacterium sp. NG2]WPR70366.1 hypothetical protein SLW70_10470 [Flavobacterium sp. NG2]